MHTWEFETNLKYLWPQLKERVNSQNNVCYKIHNHGLSMYLWRDIYSWWEGDSLFGNSLAVKFPVKSGSQQDTMLWDDFNKCFNQLHFVEAHTCEIVRQEGFIYFLIVKGPRITNKAADVWLLIIEQKYGALNKNSKSDYFSMRQITAVHMIHPTCKDSTLDYIQLWKKIL